MIGTEQLSSTDQVAEPEETRAQDHWYAGASAEFGPALVRLAVCRHIVLNSNDAATTIFIDCVGCSGP